LQVNGHAYELELLAWGGQATYQKTSDRQRNYHRDGYETSETRLLFTTRTKDCKGERTEPGLFYFFAALWTKLCRKHVQDLQLILS
jgi:hypothetical protein